MDSRAHSWPCRQLPPGFQLTPTYWHKNLSYEHVLTIGVSQRKCISTTLRVARSLWSGYFIIRYVFEKTKVWLWPIYFDLPPEIEDRMRIYLHTYIRLSKYFPPTIFDDWCTYCLYFAFAKDSPRYIAWLNKCSPAEIYNM